MSLQKLSIALLLTASLASTAAHARDGEKPYVGLDYVIVNADDDTPGAPDFELNAVRLRAGTVLAKFLAVEAHYASGVSSDTVGGFRTQLQTQYGVYLRPQLSAGALHLYGLVGYDYIQFDYKSGIAKSTTADDHDLSYGVGVQLDMGANWGLNANYVHLLKEDDVTIESVSGGIVYRF